jgi:hypothetical protein
MMRVWQCCANGDRISADMAVIEISNMLRDASMADVENVLRQAGLVFPPSPEEMEASIAALTGGDR